ncbi:MAG: hypothetical protein U0893_16355 [Chloroflexota bacterium]
MAASNTSRITSGDVVTSPTGVRKSRNASSACRVSRNRPSAGWFASVLVSMVTVPRFRDRRHSSLRNMSIGFDLTKILVSKSHPSFPWSAIW